MATVQLSQRPFLVLAGACVLHVILISFEVSTRSGIPVLQVVTFGVFAEVQRATMQTFGGVRHVWTRYVDLRSVQSENESLKRDFQKLQIQLQEERALAQRTENLRQLLELRERAGVETVAAEVIAADATPDFRTRTIDKGSSDGLKSSMAAISPAGVVGRVTLTSVRASQVQLLIDRNAAAGAMIERTRAQGVVMGQGSDTLRMEYVPGTADVKQGDLVITSGIDGIFPKGFVIGTVEIAERGPGTFHNIIVRPAVDFSRLEEVLVVTTPPPLNAANAPDAPITVVRPPGSQPPPSVNQTASAARPLNQTPRLPQPRAAQPSTNQSPRRSAGNQTAPSGTMAQPPRPPATTLSPPPGAPNQSAPRPGNQSPPRPLPRGARE